MIDSTEKDILLLLALTLMSLQGSRGEGGLEGVEVTSTSISESSESNNGLASVLTVKGNAHVCWIKWCWCEGRTWNRIGCRAFQHVGWSWPDEGGGVVSPPGLLPLTRWSSTAACCSRWNMTASRSRSAKAIIGWKSNVTVIISACQQDNLKQTDGSKWIYRERS